MKRYRFLVGGICQGVGFRWTAYHSAIKYGVCGWVQNMPDGSVRLEAQGPTQAILDFLDDLEASLNKRALTLQIDDTEQIPLEDENDFSIHY